MTPFSISCPTCTARLKVRDQRAIGELSLCPKCGSMVMITPPSPGGEPSGQPSSAGPRPGDSSQKIIVGGSIGSDFDDAAALLSDTIDDSAPPQVSQPVAPPPEKPSAVQQVRERTRTAEAPAEPVKESSPRSDTSQKSETSPPSDSLPPYEPKQEPRKAKTTAAAMALASQAPLAPPPIETPTASMSSIELDPNPQANSGSALAQAGGASAVDVAAPASLSGADAMSGAAMPPPVSHSAWATPAQLAWQRYGLIGAAVLAAVVLVSGLLAFLLRGPGDETAENIPHPAPAIEPIPDPDKNRIEPETTPADNNVEAPTDETEVAAAVPPADVPERTTDDLNIGEPEPPATEVVAEPPTDAPPLFATDDPPGRDERPLDEPTADTGLGELAPLIDAFHLPPIAPPRPPRDDATPDLPAPVPTATASRPRPDPVNINIRARLDDKIAGIDTSGAPLVKVIELITQLSTIPITIRPEALAQRKLPPAAPVSLVLNNTTVEGILTELTKKYGLAYEVIDDQIVVTSAASTGGVRIVKHDVDDLVEGDAAAQALADLVLALIAPESWKPAGGDGEIDVTASAITVKNSFDVQFRVHVLLQKLRVARTLEPRSTFHPAMFTSASRTERAKSKLDTHVRAVYHVEQPLVKVFAHLEKSAGVTFLIDWQALADVGWPPHSTAAVVADGVPLAKALDKLLDPMDLAYRAIDETTLQVTSQSALTAEAEVELYPVADVLDAKGMTPGELIDNLKKELGVGLFVDAGGPFVIRYDAPSKCLLVRLPQAQQRAIEDVISG